MYGMSRAKEKCVEMLLNGEYLHYSLTGGNENKCKLKDAGRHEMFMPRACECVLCFVLVRVCTYISSSLAATTKLHVIYNIF